MVVNGVPVRKDRHVEPVAAMALDILDSVRELRHPTSKRLLTVSIGALPTRREWFVKVWCKRYIRTNNSRRKRRLIFPSYEEQIECRKLKTCFVIQRDLCSWRYKKRPFVSVCMWSDLYVYCAWNVVRILEKKTILTDLFLNDLFSILHLMRDNDIKYWSFSNDNYSCWKANSFRNQEFFNNGCFTNSLFTSKVIGLFLSFSLRDTSWAGSSWTRGRENATILSVWW